MDFNRLIASNINNKILFRGNISLPNWNKTPMVYELININKIKNSSKIIYDEYIFKEIASNIKVERTEEIKFLSYLNINNVTYSQKNNIINDIKFKYFEHSQNEYVNDILTLYNHNLLSNKILKVFHSKKDYKEILLNDIVKRRITFMLYNYGHQNSLFYQISLYDFFNLNFNNLSKYFISIINEAYKIDLKNISKIRLMFLMNNTICEYLKDVFKLDDEYLKIKNDTNYYTITEASEITGRSKRTIRYHLQKFKENSNNNINKVIKYEKDIYNNDLLLIRKDFLNDLYKKNYYLDNNKKIKTYIMKNKLNGYYKIGKSTNPKYREKTLQSEEPQIKLIKIFNKDIETQLHKDYSKYRLRGEWFNLKKTQIEYICKHY